LNYCQTFLDKTNTSIYLQISNFIYNQVIWTSCLHEKRKTTRKTMKRHETVRKIFSCPLISSILPPRSRNTTKPFSRRKISWKSYTHYWRNSTKTWNHETRNMHSVERPYSLYIDNKNNFSQTLISLFLHRGNILYNIIITSLNE